jgi:hypothetical protein
VPLVVQKNYSAGLLPDASSTVASKFLSKRTLVNLAALAFGIPLLAVNLLFVKSGLVNIKSGALILHFEVRDQYFS